jgi:hypothetical protein
LASSTAYRVARASSPRADAYTALAAVRALHLDLTLAQWSAVFAGPELKRVGFSAKPTTTGSARDQVATLRYTSGSSAERCGELTTAHGAFTL